MKVSVRPMLNVSDGKNVDASVNISFKHEDNTIDIRMADTMVKDGFSTNGLNLGVKNDRFELTYDISNHQPKLRLNSHVNINERRIDLIYRNAISTQASSLEASLSIDDNNTAAVIYDLADYSGPNYKAATLKWTHRNGDIEFTPAYNLGSEALSIEAAYTVDEENRLKLNYNVATNNASLQWTNSSGAGGGGDLRITAQANLADGDTAKQVPRLLLEKTWDLDM